LPLAGCTPVTSNQTASGRSSGREPVTPDGGWRLHRLSRCAGADLKGTTHADTKALKLAQELFEYGEGGDAIVELELRLEESVVHDGLLLLTLAQLYVLAGQGEPTLVPTEGPAGDTGSWEKNKPRFLKRAIHLLNEARQIRPDDGCVDYLHADAVRALGDLKTADQYFMAGKGKCSLLSSLEMLARYQHLSPSSAVQTGMDSPVYPADAAADAVRGEVVLDLLVSPHGKVVQVEKVSSPDARLVKSAIKASRSSTFKPGRMGKYPVWSWARLGVVYK
jgi:TonB family protein